MDRKTDFNTFLDTFNYQENLSLYIHIPFCRSKCSYCAFYSKPNIPASEISFYVSTLTEQIKAVTDRMERPFYTVYFGGGNPGCLSVEHLESLCRTVCKNGLPEEFSIEMNPESLTKEHFFLYGSYFSRLSMGIQSLDKNALTFLQRNTTLENTLSAISLATKLQNEKKISLNFDMITCLPAFHSPTDDLSHLLSLCKPDHISLYALTLEEGTVLYDRIKNKSWPEGLPDNDRQAEILGKCRALLKEKGYEQYEVSNFYKKDKVQSLCKHNSVYWSYLQYLGLGSGACSRAFKNGQVTAHRINLKDMNEVETEVLTKEQALEEFVLMGLRHKKGLNLERLKEEFVSLQIIKKIDERIKELVHRGLYTIKETYLVPSERALMISDAVALHLLSSSQTSVLSSSAAF